MTWDRAETDREDVGARGQSLAGQRPEKRTSPVARHRLGETAAVADELAVEPDGGVHTDRREIDRPLIVGARCDVEVEAIPSIQKPARMTSPCLSLSKARPADPAMSRVTKIEKWCQREMVSGTI